jgi:hypothetical protein
LGSLVPSELVSYFPRRLVIRKALV